MVEEEDEEVAVVETLEEMTGLPAVAFSRLHAEQHLVPGVQVHVDAPAVLLTKLLGLSSSWLLLSHWSSSAQVCRGA